MAIHEIALKAHKRKSPYRQVGQTPRQVRQNRDGYSSVSSLCGNLFFAGTSGNSDLLFHATILWCQRWVTKLCIILQKRNVYFYYQHSVFNMSIPLPPRDRRGRQGLLCTFVFLLAARGKKPKGCVSLVTYTIKNFSSKTVGCCLPAKPCWHLPVITSA